MYLVVFHPFNTEYKKYKVPLMVEETTKLLWEWVRTKVAPAVQG